MLRSSKWGAEEMFKKRYGHYLDYLMMIIKHSRHPNLCFYCVKIKYNEFIFLLSLADSTVSSLKMQDARLKYHMRFSTTFTTSLAWRATCRYWKWQYWRKRVGIFIANWLCIIYFRCITSKKVSQMSLWVQSLHIQRNVLHHPKSFASLWKFNILAPEF